MTEPTAQRLLLTDAAVARQPFAENKPRILRDSKIPGFHLWVGKRTKTYRYQYELPSDNGRRGRTQIEVLGEHPHVEADEVRAKVLAFQLRRARGEPVREPAVQQAPEPRLLSFGEAWGLYRRHPPRRAAANEPSPTTKTSSTGTCPVGISGRSQA